MKCDICFRTFKRGVFCKKCNTLLCPECKMMLGDKPYCKNCWGLIFERELINDLADLLGIKDIEQMLTRKKEATHENEIPI